MIVRLIVVVLLVLNIVISAGAGTDKEMVKGEPIEGGVNNP